jgi:adenylate cyclase
MRTLLRVLGRARLSRPQPLGIALLFVLSGLQLFADSPVQSWLRNGWFDLYQIAMPRSRNTAPAVIVEIDEKSLAKHGQWPWPRTLIADLLDALAKYRPLAVGIDIIFAEPDRHSPGRLGEYHPGLDARLARELAELPDNDAVLAAALRRLPTVLGVAGTDDKTTGEPPRAQAVLRTEGDVLPHLWRFTSAVKSIDVIDRAATSRALLNADVRSAVVRRVPMLAAVGSTPFPALSLETLRIGIGADAIAVRAGVRGIESVAVGDTVVPTEPDAQLWVRYGHHDPGRFISASDVIERKVDAALIERKLVFVGLTGVGLLDQPLTPLGVRMPGVEIHAQIIENIFDGEILVRPRWTRWMEAALIFVLGAVLVIAVPAVRPLVSSLLLAGITAVLVLAGFGLFRHTGVLLDAAWPALSLNVLFGALLRGTLSETAAQRERLRRELDAQRDVTARIAGELEAARRVQMGMLPHPGLAFPNERRFELYAYMDPAREVGGDLYDFFMLGEASVFFLVGDVSGKGMPASIFMALSKALYKSNVLRSSGEPGQVARHANAEISRENSELMFVTLLACVLDVETGELVYCNAGHEAPYVLPAAAGAAIPLSEGGGPPLCALDDFPYESARHRLSPGDSLVLVSDGVTEAMNPRGELFGRTELERLLGTLPVSLTAGERVIAVRNAVREFVAGAEMSDDLTILAVRWLGKQ